MAAVESRARMTRQGEAVLRVLAQVDDFHSAQELHAMLCQRGFRIGLATVYRTSQRLERAGEVSVVYARGHEAMYRRCGRERHVHLVCRRCRRTIEVAGSELDAWAARVAERYDFAEVESTLEVLGTCRPCAGPASARR